MDKPSPAGLADFTKALVATLPEALKGIMAPSYEKLMAEHLRLSRSFTCFLVNRTCYFPEQKTYPLNTVRGTPPALDESLMPAFQAWELPFKQLANDMERITQGITSVLLRATSWQDVRNMIPDHVLRPLLPNFFNLQDLQRTSLDLYAGPPQPFAPPTQERLDREAIWDPRLLNMYERVGGTIDLYLGYKLL